MQRKKQKSFWSKPEGVTAFIVLFGIVALLYYFYPYIYYGLLTTVGTITFFILATVIVYVLIDTKLRNSFIRGFQNDMRAITSLFLQLEDTENPKALAERLGNNINQLEQVVNQVQLHNQSMKDLEEIYKIKGGEKSGKQLTLRPQASSKQTKAIAFANVYPKLDKLYQLLFQMGQNSVGVYRELEDAIKNNQKQVEGAVEKVEELEYVIQLVSTFNNTLDLKKGTYDADTFQQMEQWQNDGNSLLISPEELKEISSPNVTKPKPNLNKPDSQDNKYKDLFNF